MSFLPSPRKESSKSWWRLSSKSGKSLHRTSTDYKPSPRETSKNHVSLNAFAAVIGLKPKKIPVTDPPTHSPLTKPDKRKSRRNSTKTPSLLRCSSLPSFSPELQSCPQSAQKMPLPIRDDSLSLLGSSEATFVDGALYATHVSLSGATHTKDRPKIQLDIPDGLSTCSRTSLASSFHADFEGPHVRSSTLKSPKSSENHRVNRSMHGNVDHEAWTFPENSLSDLYQQAQRHVSSPSVASQDHTHASRYGSQPLFPPKFPPPIPSSPLFASKPLSSHSSPEVGKAHFRVIPRQSSLVRLGPAPSAPPTTKLPPPPVVPKSDEIITPSQSSSSMSFASLAAMDYAPLELQMHDGRERALPLDHPLRERLASRESTSPSSASPVRKVPMRHPTSGGSMSHSRSAPPSPIREDEGPPLPWKLKKQRSFHHSLSPVPPVPAIRQGSISGSQSPLPMPVGPPNLEQRRGSTSGLSVSSNHSRKRFFSFAGTGPRRAATSSGLPSQEDDASSLRSESQSVRALMASQVTLSPEPSPEQVSFWDEELETPSTSTPAVPPEYTPQQIMSPAEMLKVEASVMLDASTPWLDRESPSRSRTLSFTSTTTTIVSETTPSRSRSALSSPPSLRRVSEQSQFDWRWGDSLPASSPLGESRHQSRSSIREGVARAPSSCSSQLLPPGDLPASTHPSRPDVPREPDRTSPVPMIPLTPPPRRKSQRHSAATTATISPSSHFRSVMTRKQSFLDFEFEGDSRLDRSFLEFDSEAQARAR